MLTERALNDALALLLLMTQAGAVQPVLDAIAEHPYVEVRIGLIKLMALSGEDVIPGLQRLAVKPSLPAKVHSAILETVCKLMGQSIDSGNGHQYRT